MAEAQQRIGEFYAEVVLPALAARLDAAFPEFGWRRDARGWVASNQEMTHRVLGVRADRVVAHGDAPPGFLVHGGPTVLWTAYVNGGEVPRGDAVPICCARAGRSSRRRPVADRASPATRSPQPSFSTTSSGCAAANYTGRRALPLVGTSRTAASPQRRSTRSTWGSFLRSCSRRTPSKQPVTPSSRSRSPACSRTAAGPGGSAEPGETSTDESERSGRGRFKTPIPRRVTSTFAEQAAQRSRPTGCPRSFVSQSTDRREVVLVEGLIDVHHLRAHGYPNIAAVGGARVSASALTRLGRHGIESVVLAFDSDAAGRDGAARAVTDVSRADHAPALRVVESRRLGDAKDPDGFVREHGLARFRDLVDGAVCAVTWHALELTGNTSPDDPVEQRREALRRAGRWLGSLPARLSLEQEDAIGHVADRCGYSRDCCGAHLPRPILG